MRSAPLTVRAQTWRSVLLRLGAVATAVLTQSLLARGLAPFAYGQFGTVTSNLQIVGQAADLGSETTTIRYLGSDRRATTEILAPLFTLKLIVAATALGLVVVAIVALRPSAGVSSVLMLAALVLFAGALSSSRTQLIATGRSHELQGAALIQALLNLGIVAACFAVAALTLSLAVGALVIATFAGAGLLAHRAGWAPWTARPSVSGARSLARAAVPLGVAASLAAIAYRIPTTLTLILLGATAAGQFHAVYRWLDFAQILPQNLMLALFPGLVRLATEDLGARAQYREMATGLLVAGTWMAAALTVLGPGAARLLYGNSFSQAARIAPLVAWVLPPMFLSYAQGNMLIAKGLYRVQIYVASASLTLALIAYPLLASTLGLHGAAVASLCVEYGTATVGTLLVWRSFRLLPLSVAGTRILLIPLALAIATAVLRPSAWLAVCVGLACGIGALLALWQTAGSQPEPSGEIGHGALQRPDETAGS